MSDSSSESINSVQIFYIVLAALAGTLGNSLTDALQQIYEGRGFILFFGGIAGGFLLGILISILVLHTKREIEEMGSKIDEILRNLQSAKTLRYKRELPSLSLTFIEPRPLLLATVGGIVGGVIGSFSFAFLPIASQRFELAGAIAGGVLFFAVGSTLWRR